MTGYTPIYNLPYVEASDLVANYPVVSEELAENVETAIEGSGGLTLITSQTFSASAAVNVNNCFSATYTNYKLVYSIGGSADANLYFRMRVSAADNTASTYSSNYAMVTSAGALTYLNAAAGNFGILTQVDDAKATRGVADIFSPFEAVETALTANAETFRTNSYSVTGGAFHNTASSFDGITLYPSTGNITGYLKIYGYKD